MGRILYTPRYKQDLINIYQYSAENWGRTIAKRTMQQITAVEDQALANPDFGKVDAELHSSLFSYAITANSQAVFFHRLGGDVVMLTAGYYRRDWQQIMRKLEDPLRTYIDQINKR